METEEKLPKDLLKKSLRKGNEFGWKINDVPSVLNAAVENNLAVIGGQVQFVLEDGTCELYWENYDSKDRIASELWSQYVFRTAKECLEQFNKIADEDRLIQEGINSFNFLKEKVANQNINLKDHLWFILYFDEEE